MSERRQTEDISEKLPRWLLLIATAAFACYLLSRLSLDGFSGCCFIFALLYGTGAAGVSLYGGLRVRRAGFFVAAALSVPLAALYWWQVFHWPIVAQLAP